MAADTDIGHTVTGNAPKPKRKRTSTSRRSTTSRRRKPSASSKKPSASSKPRLRDTVAAIFADPNEPAKDRVVLQAIVDHLDPEKESAQSANTEEGQDQ